MYSGNKITISCVNATHTHSTKPGQKQIKPRTMGFCMLWLDSRRCSLLLPLVFKMICELHFTFTMLFADLYYCFVLGSLWRRGRERERERDRSYPHVNKFWSHGSWWQIGAHKHLHKWVYERELLVLFHCDRVVLYTFSGWNEQGL